MIHRVERFREERVLEKLWEAEGRSREDIEVGNAGSTAIALGNRSSQALLPHVPKIITREQSQMCNKIKVYYSSAVIKSYRFEIVLSSIFSVYSFSVTGR